MRAKKAKALRQELRNQGIDPTQKAFKTKCHKLVPNPLMPEGFVKKLQDSLEPQCGRALYQRLKRVS